MPRCRGSSTRAAARPAGDSLALGPDGREYILCPAGSEAEEAALENFQHVWDSAQRACGAAEGVPALEWPASPEVVVAYADRVFAFAKNARSRKNEKGHSIGLRGGNGDQHIYRRCLRRITAAPCLWGSASVAGRWGPGRVYPSDYFVPRCGAVLGCLRGALASFLAISETSWAVCRAPLGPSCGFFVGVVEPSWGPVRRSRGRSRGPFGPSRANGIPRASRIPTSPSKNNRQEN